MDHFALRDDPLSVALSEKRLSRNFQGYTVQEAPVLIGLGATGISDLGSAFAQNLPRTQDYSSQTQKTGLATCRGRKLTKEDRLRRYVITEIMCNLRLDIEQVERRFSIDFRDHFAEAKSDLEALEADGIIQTDEKHIRVSDVGRLFVRYVGFAFDAYSKARSGSRTFSRTV